MNHRYYFLVSTLPLLVFDAPPPLAPERFREICDDHLSDGDLAVIDVIIGARPAVSVASTFLDQMGVMEMHIRNAIARTRATRARVDAGPYVRPVEGCDVFIERAVSEAFGKTSPLDRERALDQLRWQQLEAFSVLDPFTSEAVFSYAARLRILARWKAMTTERGSAELDRLLAGHMTGLEKVSSY